MNISQLWPTYMYMETLTDIDNEKISEWILNYKENTETRKLTNQGGWQETISDYQDEPIFENFIEGILKILKVTRLKTEGKKVSITSWANVNEKGNWNFPHNHIGTDLSGVYYVKVPKDSGQIVFFDPRKIESAMGVQPVEGNLFMFPSYLEHMVTPSESNETRISIAFNICTK